MDRTPGNDGKQARRRGTELESAILDAAWEQLTAEGYEHFTVDTVAARARTSKPVLYRRWKTREDLLRAAVRHRGADSRPGAGRRDIRDRTESTDPRRRPSAPRAKPTSG
jgi:AcrR family transcriptional regulator